MLDVLQYIYNLLVGVVEFVANTINMLISFVGQLGTTAAFAPVIIGYLPAFLGGFVLLFFTTRIIYLIVGRN